MKTWFEIEQQFLSEHHEGYRSFTRMLVTISVAFIALLAAVVNSDNPPQSALFKMAIVFQLASLLFGVVVQHQIMIQPLSHLSWAKNEQERAKEKGSDSPIVVRRLPSKAEEVCYKLQLSMFLLAFIAASGYLVLS